MTVAEAVNACIRARVYDPDNPSASPLDFIVNTTAQAFQYQPQVTQLTDGRLVFMWHSEGDDGSFGGIRGRIYDPDNPSTSPADFAVNTTTFNNQSKPQVTGLPDGRILFTWESWDLMDGSDSCVRARIYDPDDPSASSDFIVNTRACPQLSQMTAAAR